MKRNNKALYELIMRNVAKEVKKTLNESSRYNNDTVSGFLDVISEIDFPEEFNQEDLSELFRKAFTLYKNEKLYKLFNILSDLSDKQRNDLISELDNLFNDSDYDLIKEITDPFVILEDEDYLYTNDGPVLYDVDNLIKYGETNEVNLFIDEVSSMYFED